MSDLVRMFSQISPHLIQWRKREDERDKAKKLADAGENELLQPPRSWAILENLKLQFFVLKSLVNS